MHLKSQDNPRTNSEMEPGREERWLTQKSGVGVRVCQLIGGAPGVVLTVSNKAVTTNQSGQGLSGEVPGRSPYVKAGGCQGGWWSHLVLIWALPSDLCLVSGLGVS